MDSKCLHWILTWESVMWTFAHDLCWQYASYASKVFWNSAWSLLYL